MGLPSDVLAELRGALEVRRREAGERLAALRAQFAEVVDAAAGSNVDDEHDPEGATIAFERSQVDALARSAQAELDEVAAALARMEAGTYGVCEGCGEPSPVARLQVRPTARTCVACAAARPRRSRRRTWAWRWGPPGRPSPSRRRTSPS